MRYISLFILFLLLFQVDSINGQVNIGSGEPPVPGTLLQLQNLPNEQTTLTNADKGLLLPRVQLTDVNNLFPMFSTSYDKTIQDPIHAGLMVFNTNDNLFNADGKGIYMWNGKKWNGIGLTPRTINITPKVIYLSKNKKTGSAEITPSVPGLTWEESISGVLESSDMQLSSSGNTKVMNFTRSDKVFGNKTYTFKLENNPDRNTELQVANLELIINSPLLKVGVGPEDGVVNSKTAVTAYGGQEKWEVLSYSKDVFNWDIPPKLEDGKLTFQLGAAKNPGNVDGQITVGHIDDPNLKGTITVRQNSEFVRLPDFDYILLSVYAQDSDPISSNDQNIHICLSSEIRGTGNAEVDYQFVGYQKKTLYDTKYIVTRSATSNSDPNKKIVFLQNSGNRNVSKRIDYALLNMNALAKEILTPQNNREFRFQTRATWYWPEYRAADDKQNRVTVTFRFFKGGSIYFDNKDRPVISSNAIEVRPPFEKRGVHVRKYVNKADVTETAERDKRTEPLYQVEYDLIENSGIFLPMF